LQPVRASNWLEWIRSHGRWRRSIRGGTHTQKGMEPVDQAAQNLEDLATQLTGIEHQYKIE
jgi:hypothetical protein